MKTKKPTMKLLSQLLLATSIAASSCVFAADPGQAQVSVIASGMYVSSPGTANVKSMTLRIGAPDDSVIELKSNGASLDWSAAGMADGLYRYEAYVTSVTDGSEKTETTITRGYLKVFQGMIMQEQQPAEVVGEDSSSLFEGLRDELQAVAGNMLELLVPDAQAATLTASGALSGDVVLDSTATTNTQDWIISGKALSNTSGSFSLIDDIDDVNHNNIAVFDIAHSLNNENSLIVDGNGDVGLANGGFYFDRSGKRIGINTITPQTGIHVLSTSSKSTMALRMEDTTDSTWDIGQSSIGNFFVSIVTNGSGGPTGTRFTIEDSTGDAGVGTSSPITRLHVVGDAPGSDAVEEVFRVQSPTAPQQVFKNNGTGKQWFFAMTATDDFKVSLDGTGKIEAKFFQNGNLQIAGTLTQLSDRASKQDIVAVDNKKILDALASMPISTWEYKADDGVAHLGPMAQDFHAAFGLGDNPKGISTIDTGGVALAAIKGLNEVVLSKDTEIKSLRSELAANSAELAELKEMVHALATKDQVASAK